MKTDLKINLSLVADPHSNDEAKHDNLTRRKGSIRGIIINTKLANQDRAYGMTRPMADFPF